jgi:hypothetical protein
MRKVTATNKPHRERSPIVHMPEVFILHGCGVHVAPQRLPVTLQKIEMQKTRCWRDEAQFSAAAFGWNTDC